MRPIIAIVGRPNVGKSTLLNRLARREVALVADTPGVTRDRLFVESQFAGRPVVLVDTGGFDADPKDDLSKSVVTQTRAAITEADLILFICDARDGLRPGDREVANLLRRSRKPFVCLVNKADPGAAAREEWDFYQLGLEVFAISALHGTGLDVVEEAVKQKLPAEQTELEPPTKYHLHLCLLGRPNVGKSSLANRLVGEHRQIVSPMPGTTRDAVDLAFEHNGESFLLVDTPGVRRKARIQETLEHHSVLAALRSTERADVAVVVLDGSIPYSDQDARLLNLVDSRGRALIVVINKVDLWTRGDQRKKYLEDLKHGMRFVAYAPVLEMSAQTGEGVGRILDQADRVNRNMQKRISTGDLNQFIEATLEQHEPPAIKGRRARIYYVTQVEVAPPTFVAWVNDPEKLPTSYRRYVDRKLRKTYSFEGCPVRWIYRKRSREAGEWHK